MVRRWTPRSSAPSRACVIASWGRAGSWKSRWLPGRATGLRFTSRDPQQNRDELIDLAHLVEEMIGAGLHAALAHRRQVVVGQHDDPHVATVLDVLVAGPGLADHADAAAGAQFHVDHDGVVGD